MGPCHWVALRRMKWNRCPVKLGHPTVAGCASTACLGRQTCLACSFACLFVICLLLVFVSECFVCVCVSVCPARFALVSAGLAWSICLCLSLSVCFRVCVFLFVSLFGCLCFVLFLLSRLFAFVVGHLVSRSVGWLAC